LSSTAPTPTTWTLKLLLMSCRVVSRGVGAVLLNLLLRMARDAGVRLMAEFVPTERNRMMYVTYKFAGFGEVEKRGDLVLLAHDLREIQALPNYVQVEVQS
jgi:predicted enzyme involved in methoxymalonyl-ACP biosynthesis